MLLIRYPLASEWHSIVDGLFTAFPQLNTHEVGISDVRVTLYFLLSKYGIVTFFLQIRPSRVWTQLQCCCPDSQL